MLKRAMQYGLEWWRGLSASRHVILALYTIVGAFLALVGARVVRTEWFYSGNYEQNYFPGFYSYDILLFVGLCAAVYVVTCLALAGVNYLYARIPLRASRFSPWTFFIVSWVVIFLCWIPYFFVNFPGIIYADSIVIIKQALGINALTTHHPLAYTGFIALCLRVGNAFFGSNIAGIAIYTIIQMLFVSGVCAYAISWMARHYIPAPALVVVCAIFALCSIFPIHAASMWKDAAYAAWMLLLALQLFDIVFARKLLLRTSTYAKMIVLGLAVCFARTNGVYTMVCVWVVLALVVLFSRDFAAQASLNYAKDRGAVSAMQGATQGRLGGNAGLRGRLCARIIAAALINFAVYFGAFFAAAAFFDAKDEPVESYGIPLQQVAAVVVYDGVLTPDQENFLDTLLPLGEYKGEYIPCSVDGIKWADKFDTDFFNEHQTEFLQNWLAICPNNLSIYARAFIMESYEYWTFGDIRRNIHVNYVNDKYDAPDLDITETNLLEQWFGEGVSALFPYRFLTLGEGVVSWLVLFAGLFLFVMRSAKEKTEREGAHVQNQRIEQAFDALALRERREFMHPWWLVLLPAVSSWITVLLSSPFAALPRYVLPSIFLLPVLLLLPWLIGSTASHDA